MNRLKKFFIGIVIIVIVTAASFQVMSSNIIKKAHDVTIDDLDFSDIEDGIYEGEYSIPPVNTRVLTRVEDGMIKGIEIVEHFNGMGKPAESIIDDVIEEQSLDVELISGATVSSKSILKAIEKSIK